MKILSSYPVSETNPYFYAGMKFWSDGVITVPSWKSDEILKLNQFEFKAFFIILFDYQYQSNCGWFKELKVMYRSKELTNYFDITLAKARQITVALLERGIIHRSKGRDFYFINPEYVVNIVNPVDHPTYSVLRNKEGEVVDMIETDYSNTPAPTSIPEILDDDSP